MGRQLATVIEMLDFHRKIYVALQTARKTASKQ
jgi:hypothetical protein